MKPTLTQQQKDTLYNAALDSVTVITLISLQATISVEDVATATRNISFLRNAVSQGNLQGRDLTDITAAISTRLTIK